MSRAERAALRDRASMGSVGAMWLALLLAAAPAEAARAYSLLTYVAGDYAAAVGASGEVLSPQEHEEQLIFVGDAARDLRAAAAADLAAQAEALGARIAANAAPLQVVPLAQALTGRIAQRFQLALLPPRAPDLQQGSALYQQACAPCHGADGTPRVEHLELSTRPTAFSSKEEVARLSPQRIFTAVSFGVPGTAMPSFGGVLEQSAIWDVAYAVLLLARPAAERRRGEELVRTLPLRPDWLQLAVRTDEQLRAVLAQSPFSAADREAVLAAVRSAWSDPAQRSTTPGSGVRAGASTRGW
jgi:high-affinity iron transporter